MIELTLLTGVILGFLIGWIGRDLYQSNRESNDLP